VIPQHIVGLTRLDPVPEALQNPQVVGAPIDHVAHTMQMKIGPQSGLKTPEKRIEFVRTTLHIPHKGMSPVR
jgi:hypothetical protein